MVLGALLVSGMARAEGEASVGNTPERAALSASSEQGPRLGDRPELDRIIELYMAGGYKRCSDELAHFLDEGNSDAFKDPAVVETGRLYFASCSLLDDHREEARSALRMALQENPLMRSPDSLTFPPPVVSLFLEVRDEVQQLIADREKEQVMELRRENERARREAERRENREEALKKLATEESIIAKNSRVVASIPFGMGQFQNGNSTLGTVALVSEGLLLATALSSALILEYLTSEADTTAGKIDDKDQFNQQRSTAYSTMKWSSWTLLGVCALGIVEAHLNFVDERRLGTRHRPLPSDLEIEREGRDEIAETSGSPTIYPTFAVGPQGGHVGVFGTF